VKGTLIESSEGPRTLGARRVQRPDDLRRLSAAWRPRLELDSARDLDPLKSHDEKMAAVDSALDKYISYSPGCTFDNPTGATHPRDSMRRRVVTLPPVPAGLPRPPVLLGGPSSHCSSS